MRTNKLENKTYYKYIEATLESIAEHGGLTGVNLAIISKKLGYAHTNAYNYFQGFEGLVFAAFDEAIVRYGNSVIRELDLIDDGYQYVLQFVKNIIDFALNNPGYYRFIGSDDFNISGLSHSTIEKVIQLKQFFLDVIYSVTKSSISRAESDDDANILMSYLDGELFNIINKRAFSDDQTEIRMINNTMRLLKLFTSKDTCNADKDLSTDCHIKAEIPLYLKKSQ
jgi:AcrR family transcriptional regulator